MCPGSSAQNSNGCPIAFDYLSPQDRRICRQIEAGTVYEYFGHYPRSVYSLDGDQALLEAIGHPLLFWAEDPGQPVELIRAEPVLEVLRRKDKLELRLQPFPHPERNLIPQREGGRRLRLVAFSAQHRRIAEILGQGGIAVPLKAKEQVTLEPHERNHAVVAGIFKLRF